MPYSFRPGFRGYRKPEVIPEGKLSEVLARIETRGLYVLSTGGRNGARSASLRSRALATISEVGVPVPLAELLRRAARAVGPEEGFDPATVRGGLFLAAGAKPAVYLAVERDGDGNYRAAKDIPTPDPAFFGAGKSFPRGSIVLSAADAAARTAALGAGAVLSLGSVEPATRSDPLADPAPVLATVGADASDARPDPLADAVPAKGKRRA